MRALFFSVLLLFHALATAYTTDFDSVVVGTSPISMLEALYRAHSGERVLVVEEADRCGGAWKSIAICGVPHVDLGCHQMGSDLQVRDFLCDYLGCELVCLDDPSCAYIHEGEKSGGGYYPAGGCHELIEKILALYAKSAISLLLESRLERLWIDEEREIAHVQVGEEVYSTSKVVATPSSFLHVENHSQVRTPKANRAQYYHIYLLIEDPTPPSFSYRYGGGIGISRMMNITPFAGLTGTGVQLIALQTHNGYYLDHHDEFFAHLKSQGSISQKAVLLCSENVVYEQCQLDKQHIQPYQSQIIEVLNTGHFAAMAGYIDKWKRVLQPWQPCSLDMPSRKGIAIGG